MNTHIAFLDQAVALAKTINVKQVQPGPRVASLFVYNGEIVAQGVFCNRGEPHAEKKCILALEKDFFGEVLEKIKNEGTLYITLEPCIARKGKVTPPCMDFLVEKGIQRVVCGEKDPFYNGASLDCLQKAGVMAEFVLHGGCKALVRPFWVWKTEKRPYGIVKWAISTNGLVSAPKTNWFTCVESKRLVHAWRTEANCIITSTKTVLADNPLLDVRYGDENINPPDVFVLGKTPIPLDLRIFGVVRRKVELMPERNVKQIMKYIAEQGYTSFFTECGPVLGLALLKADLVDEIRLFVAPFVWKNGINAVFGDKMTDVLKHFALDSVEMVGGDVLVVYRK